MSATVWTPKLIIANGPVIPCPAIEELFPWLDRDVKKLVGDALLKPIEDRIRFMAGSLSNYASKAIQDLLWGKTAYAGETTIFGGLWTAALDDTSAGNTAGEAAYISYGRLSLTNNTTIFAAGSGTTTYTKTFPSDAAKNFATSTGGTAPTCTYFFFLNGNAGTSADKGMAWCTITSVVINTGDTPQVAQNAFTLVQD